MDEFKQKAAASKECTALVPYKNNTQLANINTQISTTHTQVIGEIKNDVINLDRIGSALKTDRYHAFPDIVDNYVGYATKTSINNGTLYQIEGAYRNKPGRFEWIIQEGHVTHRMFVPGGGVSGTPIKL